MLNKLVYFFSLSFIYCCNSANIPPKTWHGYEHCTKSDPNKLNIHIVAHSHDDVGWLKTVDQYYYGTHPMTQKAGVRSIIDSYVDALLKNPERKFIQVETAFFWHWWKDQNEEKRNIYRNLIKEGRLEIIGGGWSMADEAVTHYHSLIDQYTWGFRRLEDSLGQFARPKIGWQIDPFGHSREQAGMFAQLGFDGYFFGRLDWIDKMDRLAEKKAEFIWKGNPNLGKKGDIFTGILYNNYSPPPGYCFDFLCAVEPIVDNVFSPEYNVPSRIDNYLRFTKRQSSHYRTNNVIMTMGDDFTYQDAEYYYKNLDLLIRYSNLRNGSDYNMFYSTPSCYLKALHDEYLRWPQKTDDFFPYASDPHAYWTGYFTSRPTLKYFERLGNNYLQVVKQLSSIKPEMHDEESLNEFREAMGVMQHHDAVTGTEKQHVAADYARILYKAFAKNDKIVENKLRELTQKKGPSTLEFKSCLLLNISACEETELNKQFVVTIYNPLSQKISQFVRLPVTGHSYSIKDHLGRKIVNQMVPIINKIRIMPGRSSSATHELVFEATDIPAMGFKSFYIIREESLNNDISYQDITKKPFTINTSNQGIKLEIDEHNQLTIKVTRENEQQVIPQIMYYEAAEGNNEVFENRSSGAYIFRPRSFYPQTLNETSSRTALVQGSIVTELYIERNEWITEVIRMYSNTDFIEYNWIVGPIPVKDGIGKEIIVRYNSTVGNTDGIFYTDSNGRQIIKRKRRFVDDNKYEKDINRTLSEPVAGNYYPVTNKIFLQNEETHVRLSILNDRSQGGSSLNDGQLELMVHRRLLRDDAFGVAEALNETAFGEGLVATGKHYIHIGNVNSNPEFIKQEKLKTVQLSLQPWITITPLNEMSFEDYENNYLMLFSTLKKKLPKNINILTLEPWRNESILLRFEHLYEIGEDRVMSQPVEINIQDLFATFNITKITELTLGANLELSKLDRFEWMSEETNSFDDNNNDEVPVTIIEDMINVVMKPSEIRTFIIQIK